MVLTKLNILCTHWILWPIVAYPVNSVSQTDFIPSFILVDKDTSLVVYNSDIFSIDWLIRLSEKYRFYEAVFLSKNLIWNMTGIKSNYLSFICELSITFSVLNNIIYLQKYVVMIKEPKIDSVFVYFPVYLCIISIDF